MARKGDTPKAGDVTEKVDRRATDMDDKGEHIEEAADDVQTERQTRERLDLGGTTDAAEAIAQAIEAAEDVSVEQFDSESQDLEEVHSDSQDHEDELQERSDTSSSDLGKISDASAEIHSDTANDQLVDAKGAAMKDIEFLEQEMRRAEEAREESQRFQAEQARRVGGAGGA